MGFGDYPAEYNPAKHGPYDPARYYGKRKHQITVKFTNLLLIFNKSLDPHSR